MSSNLLTRETVMERVAERIEQRRLEDAARRRGEELDRWFEGLRIVVGDEAWAALVPADIRSSLPSTVMSAEMDARKASEAPPKTSERFSLTKWVASVLESAENGLSYEDFLRIAQETQPPDGPQNDPSAFGRFLELSANRGRLRKRADLYYSIKLSDQMPPRSSVATSRTPELKNALLARIRDIGGRGRARDIIKPVLQNPQIAEKFGPSSQYPYSLLSRMVIEGELQKEGQDYVLPDSDVPESE